MAKIEREVVKEGVCYTSNIKCKTIEGLRHDELFIAVQTEKPTEICIGAYFGLYTVKIEDIVDVVHAALEEANKGV